ncbi:Diaminopimelate decarboxylase [Corynebacterium occultum]|uniref:Diaminopimelate decarboxylase n=1 Tax=Corynebacterium occultum TaxID=2675219 RepID=A0A6B8W202_9CORY|nr:FAD/NAD(P)-binding protein [Corynebacterium occultum]QGU06037.1 Diaminopimelate decarboxylase [Corynebacterium occultum]
MRVAVIGGGPRALWAVEELLHQAHTHQVPVEIDVWEPGELGAGSAYSPRQPEHWRLNVTSAIIRTRRRSFDQWRLEEGEEQPLEPFPARRLVGCFFAEEWRELLCHLPEGCTLRQVPRRVSSLEPVGERWQVEGREYEEVLLVTGHAPEWPGALPRGEGVLGVYPAAQLARIPAGARVAVRGAALTFIDAVLELTVGRGGRMRGSGYQPSGREPAVIFPVTRKGRFMTVKPEPGGPLTQLDLAEAVAAGQAGVRLSRDLAELCEVLAETSAQMLAVAREGCREAGVEEEIRGVLAGRDGSGDPVRDLRRSRDVACGLLEPGAEWAVGEAWRRLYPAIVARTSFGGRVDMPGFAELAVRLERVGFGPPVVNATQLLTLIDAGLIDISRMAGGEMDADVLVDAVLSPPGVVPGTLAAGLVERGLAEQGPGRGITVARDGTVVGQRHLAVAGRDSEDVVLGPDTLSRTLHDVIPRWAMRVIEDNGKKVLRAQGMAATVPLTGRLEPWAVELLEDPQRCQDLVAEFASPVNVLRPEPMLRNIEELVRAGEDAGVETRVFFARKANKALAFVDTVRDAGHSVDVAGERELRQVLGRGVPGERIILSAAVKPDELLQLAVAEGVTISVDSVPELRRIEKIAGAQGQIAHLAPRLAPDPAQLPPTRFGERLAVWQGVMGELSAAVEINGVHIHLHGYAARDRQTALVEAFALIDAARDAGQQPEFIDLGGGVPMSYLDDAAQWENFQQAREAMNRGEIEPFTWKADPLQSTYPFHQSPTRGEWLRELLEGEGTPGGGSIAAEFISRGLRLHLEPGRSVLDGCGVILARVAFLKHRSDGVPLVGLEMNRTQCRTTSDDILVDPVLVRSPGPATEEAGWGPESEGFLVGAYCIEDEVIVRRRMRFPEGIAPGDIVGIPNTAGYFMHILESASHQIPLARNVVLAGGDAALDDIDQV